MIPRLKPNLGFKELVSACKFWQKDAVARFEMKFAKLMGQKYAVAFPYGRTGIIATLKAMGLKNQEVICPAYTCVVVAHAIVTSGNIPVFIDCDEKTYNMDAQLLEKAINENTGAIIATSIFGNPVNIDVFNMLQRKYPHIEIIQDCAHSFAAEWKGQPVQLEGRGAIFGLNISKLMTSIFGGMVTTDDKNFYHSVLLQRKEMLYPAGPFKSLRRWLYLCASIVAFSPLVYGLINRLERSGFLNRFVKYFDESKIDMPSDYLEKMVPIEARVGLVQCDKYNSIIEHRRMLARYYYQQLRHLSHLKMPQLDEGATFSHFVIYTKDAQSLIVYLLEKGIQLGEKLDYHIPSLYAYKNYRYESHGISQNLPGNVINLPLHSGICMQKAREVIGVVCSFYEKLQTTHTVSHLQ